MAGLWLACCGQDDLIQVAQEIEARTPSAQILRFSGVGHPALVSGTLPNGATGAVIAARGATGDEVERTVCEIARSGCVPQILVVADRLDAGLIARLFHAGATEVIAAEDAGVNIAGRAADSCVEWSSQTDLRARGARRDGTSREGKRYRKREHAGDDVASGAKAAAVEEGTLEGEARGPGGDRGAAGELSRASRSEASRAPAPGTAASPGQVPTPPAAREAPALTSGRAAPVVTAISGRGGSGKTTLICAMACCAARMGLRAAILDLDLMFGDAHRLLGVDEPRDLVRIGRAGADGLADADIEASAMRIAPGLTLWGPIERPELAETMGEPCERLIAALRTLSDVIFIDTSVFWGDAAAAAVAAGDRCLIVGTAGPSASSSAARAADLAGRLGVPRTKMASVLMRFGSPSCGEEAAMRFEMATSLKSRIRIRDGGPEVAELSAFGRMHELMAGDGEFARSVRGPTVETLRELGCKVEEAHADQAVAEVKPRLRLPWRGREGDGR